MDDNTNRTRRMQARFSSSSIFSSAAFALVAGLALLPSLGGCGGGGQTKPAPAPKETTSEVFAPFSEQAPEVLGTNPKTPGKPELEKIGSWSIVIVGASGDNAEVVARDMLHKVQLKGGLPEAYLERRGKSVVVAYGRYNGADDPQAHRDLARIQTMEIDGATPFAGALLAPPPFGSVQGSIPEYNLSNVKQARGKDALYTLQVAIYKNLKTNAPKPEELAQFRQAAEKYVVDLRREGEEAFYYHSPRGSTITVGVFGPKDHDPLKPGMDSMALVEKRRKFPLNIVNGAEYLVRSRGQEKATAQSSLLVPIPN